MSTDRPVLGLAYPLSKSLKVLKLFSECLNTGTQVNVRRIRNGLFVRFDL